MKIEKKFEHPEHKQNKTKQNTQMKNRKIPKT
jgi:hypothetical protein